MNNNKRVRTLSGLFFLLFFFFASNAHAFSFKSLFTFKKDRSIKLHVLNHANGQKQPAHVKVGVYMLHVGRYDLQSASIRMDFYLIFRCKPVCDKLNFEIMNATSSTVKLAVKQKDYLVYRVQAELNKCNNLRNYPFDHHDLDVIIENRQQTSDQMIFEVDPGITALDNDLDVVGFKLLPNWTAKVTNHYYKVFQQTFSSYKFSMYIERPWLAGILKGILPALIIIGCSFLALFMRIDHVSQRLGIATSTLIASEVFHLNLTSSIPPLGYVTFADMFMFINYICLLLILIEVILTMYFVESEHKAKAERLNWNCAWIIPLLWFIMQTINWFMFVNLG
ncbi:MAG: hypothetical protein H0U71_06565 [Gammaproteobacteria bacterium]|nr:hypothetical protein [Gammaproteobacteria bacterium]